MAEGGFVVKINGKVVCNCFAVAFDYDEWKYTVNETETRELPDDIKSITIETSS